MASNQKITVTLAGNLDEQSFRNAVSKMQAVINKSDLDHNMKTSMQSTVTSIEDGLQKIKNNFNKGTLNVQQIKDLEELTKKIQTNYEKIQRTYSQLSNVQLTKEQTGAIDQINNELTKLIKDANNAINKLQSDFKKETKVSFQDVDRESLINESEQLQKQLTDLSKKENSEAFNEKVELHRQAIQKEVQEEEKKNNKIKELLSQHIKQEMSIRRKGKGIAGALPSTYEGYEKSLANTEENLRRLNDLRDEEKKLAEGETLSTKRQKELNLLESQEKTLKRKLNLYKEIASSSIVDDRALKEMGVRGRKVETLGEGVATTDRKNEIEIENQLENARKKALEQINSEIKVLAKKDAEIKKIQATYDSYNKKIKTNEENIKQVVAIKKEEIAQIEKNAHQDFKKSQTEANNAISTGTKAIKEYSTNVKTSSIEADKASLAYEVMGRQVESVAQHFMRYASVVYILRAVTKEIQNAKNTVEGLDQTITQIGIVTGQTRDQVWTLFDRFNESAAQLNTTTANYLEGSKIFYQQGLRTNQVMEMVTATTVGAALAETDFAQASETLTAAINGFNMEATEAMNVTDKMAAVGASSAASFNELSTAMTKVSASAYTAGIDFDHLMGILAKGIETTREAPEAKPIVGTFLIGCLKQQGESKNEQKNIFTIGPSIEQIQRNTIYQSGCQVF